jgi:hypothetical protein
MTKKELIIALVKHYKSVIKEIKVTKKDNINFILELNNVELGICYCAYKQFEQNIYNKRWVERYSLTRGKWGTYPCWTANKKQVVDALQVRVDNLNKELKTYKK